MKNRVKIFEYSMNSRKNSVSRSKCTEGIFDKQIPILIYKDKIFFFPFHAIAVAADRVKRVKQTLKS